MLRWLCLLLTWMALSGLLSPSYGQSLTDEDKREVLLRLHELRVARAELQVLHDHLEKRDALDAREKAAWERSLELEKRATGLAERERDLEKSRGDFLDTQLKAATRGRGVGCRIAKILTIGIARCN